MSTRSKRGQVEPKTRENTHGRFVNEDDTADYWGDDYDTLGWKPKETKKAKDCDRVTDFRMIHVRGTRYPNEKGDGTEYREVSVCCWCHKSWQSVNVTKLINHLVHRSGRDVAVCKADIPEYALAEYKKFDQRQRLAVTQPSNKKKKANEAFEEGDESFAAEEKRADADGPLSPPAKGRDNCLALDEAITRWCIVEGMEKHVVGTPLFRNVLRAARSVGDSYKPPSQTTMHTVHLNNLYQNLFDSVISEWGDRRKTRGVTLIADASAETVPPLVLVSACCPNGRRVVLDAINCARDNEPGVKDAEFFAPRLDRHIESLGNVNLVVIEGGDNFDLAKKYLEEKWPSLFVIRGAGEIVHKFLDRISKTPQYQLLSYLCFAAYEAITTHPPVHENFMISTLHLNNDRKVPYSLINPGKRHDNTLFAMHRLVLLQASVRVTLSSRIFREKRNGASSLDPVVHCLVSDSFYGALELFVRAMHPTTLVLERLQRGELLLDRLHHYTRRMSASVSAQFDLLRKCDFFLEAWPKSFCEKTIIDGVPKRPEFFVREDIGSGDPTGAEANGFRNYVKPPADPQGSGHPTAIEVNSEAGDTRKRSDGSGLRGGTDPIVSENELLTNRYDPESLARTLQNEWHSSRGLMENPLSIVAWMLCPEKDVYEDLAKEPEEDRKRSSFVYVVKRVLPLIRDVVVPTLSEKELFAKLDMEYATFCTERTSKLIADSRMEDAIEFHSNHTLEDTVALGAATHFIAGKPCSAAGHLRWEGLQDIHKDDAFQSIAGKPDMTDKYSALYANHLWSTQIEAATDTVLPWTREEDGTLFDASDSAGTHAHIGHIPVKRILPIYPDEPLGPIGSFPDGEGSSDEDEEATQNRLARELTNRLSGICMHIVDQANEGQTFLVKISEIKYSQEKGLLEAECERDSSNGTKTLPLSSLYRFLLDEKLPNRPLLLRQGVAIFSEQNYKERSSKVERYLSTSTGAVCTDASIPPQPTSVDDEDDDGAENNEDDEDDHGDDEQDDDKHNKKQDDDEDDHEDDDEDDGKDDSEEEDDDPDDYQDNNSSKKNQNAKTRRRLRYNASNNHDGDSEDAEMDEQEESLDSDEEEESEEDDQPEEVGDRQDNDDIQLEDEEDPAEENENDDDGIGDGAGGGGNASDDSGSDVRPRVARKRKSHRFASDESSSSGGGSGNASDDGGSDERPRAARKSRRLASLKSSDRKAKIRKKNLKLYKSKQKKSASSDEASICGSDEFVPTPSSQESDE